MKLEPGTRVLDLLTAYPFVKEYFLKLHPHFEKLNNPVMLKTVGRVATLNMAADAAKIPIDNLIAGIAEEVKKTTGEEVETTNS
jgi:hypothetical protein